MLRQVGILLCEYQEGVALELRRVLPSEEASWGFSPIALLFRRRCGPQSCCDAVGHSASASYVGELFIVGVGSADSDFENLLLGSSGGVLVVEGAENALVTAP